MGVVEDEGLAEDPVPFATNRLVIAVPTGNPAGIEVPADLADDGIKLVLAAPEVPVGNYAREMFKRLKIAPEVESNVVSNEEDVKAVVSKVRLGEADAGVVYRTDITSAVEGDLELIEVPPGASSPIAVYPITVVGETDNPKEAQDWVDLVLSDEGQQVLEDFAFGSPAQ
jgi:molybdate transport system substrate-binding protein